MHLVYQSRNCCPSTRANDDHDWNNTSKLYLKPYFINECGRNVYYITAFHDTEILMLGLHARDIRTEPSKELSYYSSNVIKIQSKVRTKFNFQITR